MIDLKIDVGNYLLYRLTETLKGGIMINDGFLQLE